MKIRNISDKVISVGMTMIMPGTVITVSDDRANTPAVKMLIRKGFLETDGNEKKKKSSPKSGGEPKPEGNDGDPNPGEGE